MANDNSMFLCTASVVAVNNSNLFGIMHDGWSMEICGWMEGYDAEMIDIVWVLLDFDEIWYDGAVQPFWASRPLKISKFQKSKMAAAAILKNWKLAISRPRFNRLWRNLARWCISNLLTVPTVKNLKFYKSDRRPCTSQHQQNTGYGILLLCAQFNHGLVNSAMGQIPCSTERISCLQYVCYCRVAGHPLAQNERCLHMFLLEPSIDKDYVPGKVRTTWINELSTPASHQVYTAADLLVHWPLTRVPQMTSLGRGSFR